MTQPLAPLKPGRRHFLGTGGRWLMTGALLPLAQPALASLGARELPHSSRAQSDAQIEQFIRDWADTIYHPVGTCRMGCGPLDVVDAQLRVHGLQALRVVDASIMPRIVSGNTNAPTVMIAERAVDLLRQAA